MPLLTSIPAPLPFNNNFTQFVFLKGAFKSTFTYGRHDEHCYHKAPRAPQSYVRISAIVIFPKLDVHSVDSPSLLCLTRRKQPYPQFHFRLKLKRLFSDIEQFLLKPRRFQRHDFHPVPGATTSARK